jgi:DNA modification methylase
MTESTHSHLLPEDTLEASNDFAPDARVTLFHGDRLALLKQIAASGAEAELIVTSPPYNLGKEYEKQTSLEAYIERQRRTIEAALSVLSATGSICWQVGNYIEGSSREKETYPLDIVLFQIFKEFDLKLRNRIVWHFGHGYHEHIRFSGRHETILWFTWNTEDYTFNLDPVRVPQKYPGKRHYKGRNRGKLSGNPKGKNPSDVWEIPNVKANHPEKTGHPCQFPIGLVERLVLALTNEDDLIIDPYMGVGTTAVAALMNNRRAAGADTEEDYLEIARERLRRLEAGTLPIRPRDKPVYVPQRTSSVAQVPDEWKSNADSIFADQDSAN